MVVVLGGSFRAVVTGLIDHLIMPLLGDVTPKKQRHIRWTCSRREIGAFLAAVLNLPPC